MYMYRHTCVYVRRMLCYLMPLLHSDGISKMVILPVEEKRMLLACCSEICDGVNIDDEVVIHEIKRVIREENGRKVLYTRNCYVATTAQDVVVITSFIIFKKLTSPPINVYGLLCYASSCTTWKAKVFNMKH